MSKSHGYATWRTIDERRELSAAAAEGLARGAHAEHNVQVIAHAVHKLIVHNLFGEGRIAHKVRVKGGGDLLRKSGHTHRFGGGESLLLDDVAQLLDDLEQLVRRKQVGHLAAVEDVVQILQEPLLLATKQTKSLEKKPKTTEDASSSAMQSVFCACLNDVVFGEQEDDVLAMDACSGHHFLQMLLRSGSRSVSPGGGDLASIRAPGTPGSRNRA